MAWLGEEATDDGPMTELIEGALYRHRQPLFGELRSPSSTPLRYIDGQGGATLGQRGFFKDFRPQLHQVVLGIVLDGWMAGSAEHVPSAPYLGHRKRGAAVSWLILEVDPSIIGSDVVDAIRCHLAEVQG